MKKGLPAWAVLTIICALLGLILGATYAVTKGPIEDQAIAKAVAARKEVCPDADSFEQVELPDGALVDNCYRAMKDGKQVGWAVQTTEKGFGGEIEVQTGLDMDGTLTGVNVGGANFSETAGLGAKTKEPEFTSQFAGKTLPVAPKGNIDAVSGATISSSAVCRAVNTAGDFVKTVD